MYKLILVCAVAVLLSSCGSLGIKLVGTGPGGAVTTADQILYGVRGYCASWPITHAAFTGLAGSGIIKNFPDDAKFWEGTVNAGSISVCNEVVVADASGVPLNLTRLNQIMKTLTDATLAVNDYIVGISKPKP